MLARVEVTLTVLRCPSAYLGGFMSKGECWCRGGEDVLVLRVNDHQC